MDVTDSELADGSVVEDELVFAGKILWGDEVRDVEILLTKSSDVLIGTAYLACSGEVEEMQKIIIEISPHARDQMVERGASEAEVYLAIEKGEVEPARKGRKQFKKSFQFNEVWRGKQYKIKQVAPIVADKDDKLVVVTVYVFYF
ncbi:DUF4258 domain-containing protein [bacterium]|nr:DUF4258 domain-containing protein [bacterium]MBU1614512.1 DUF4258 domain-containing protein [bacterium]